MQTEHYIVENIAEFSVHSEAVKKLSAYLNQIEGIFPVIEEVFGQKWKDNHIHILLNDSKSGASYGRPKGVHTVEMGINNRNIGEKYPESLWGCLFHETHHAFLNHIDNREILNGGHEKEVFNFSFLATTYLKLKEKGIIDAQLYEHFLKKLEGELTHGESSNDVRDLFKEYVDIFSVDTKNFAKFISYMKSSDSVFTDVSRFRQDLDEARKFLGIARIL